MSVTPVHHVPISPYLKRVAQVQFVEHSSVMYSSTADFKTALSLKQYAAVPLTVGDEVSPCNVGLVVVGGEVDLSVEGLIVGGDVTPGEEVGLVVVGVEVGIAVDGLEVVGCDVGLAVVLMVGGDIAPGKVGLVVVGVKVGLAVDGLEVVGDCVGLAVVGVEVGLAVDGLGVVGCEVGI